MSHHTACIKTNGFKASDPSVSRAGHVLKPMVLRHQIRLMTRDIKMFNRGIAPQRDTKMATKKRRPKNQWLMSRRIVSFADGLIFLMQMCNKCYLSGKEQIRL